jgi:3,4-dihydroxy-9,10-secoandrosta-1,3,5(10)-triene-9,17-dione 4,5-dioxygenase
MIDIRSLGYIVIQSTDLGKWQEYAADVLGMMIAPSSDASHLHIKIDDRPFRFEILKGDKDTYMLAGWELANQEAFEQAKQALDKAKVKYQQVDNATVKRRAVSDAIVFSDPSGNKLELFYGGGLDYAPFASPLGVSGFVTGDDGNLGLGHVVLAAEKMDATYKFYKELLGFGDSDAMQVPNPDGSASPIQFMHCANPRHHSLALYGVPNAMFPAGCVHAMVEVSTVDEVGLCLDRVQQRNIHIFSTLGRHTNDRMLSFYMMTPTGFALEYGCQGRTMDWNTFTPTTTTGRGSLWGHEFNLPS